jgi:hypothetical protein
LLSAPVDYRQAYLDQLPKEAPKEQLLDPVQFKWDDYHADAMNLADDLDDDDDFDDDDWLPTDMKRQGKKQQPQWQSAYQKQQSERDLAFAEFADEIEECKEHIEALKEYMAMMGFCVYATITHDPNRAAEILHKAEQLMLLSDMGD